MRQQRSHDAHPPEPEVGLVCSEWQTGIKLTEAAEWRNPDKPGMFARERRVTWAHYPYRYWLTNSEKEPTPNVPGRLNSMLHLRRVSAALTGSGLAEVADFYAIEGVLYGVLTCNVRPDVTIMSDEELDVLEGGANFTIDNELFLPNAEDELEFSSALKQGFMDGVAAYEN